MRTVDGQDPGNLGDQRPETVKSWGFRGVGDAGLSVAVYRRPDRLVIEIHAPLDLLDLDGLTDSSEPGPGGQGR